jgi:hypothetical protein
MANFRRSDLDPFLWWQGLVTNSAVYDRFGNQNTFEARVLQKQENRFFVRIIDPRMAHETFLSDPCDLSQTVGDPSAAAALIYGLHSEMVVTDTELQQSLQSGDKIRVRCKSGLNGDKFDLRNVEFVSIVEKATNAGNSSNRTCPPPASSVNFGNAAPLGGSGFAPIPLGENGEPIYSDSRDPGNCPWSNGREALRAVWQSSDGLYSQWDGTTVFNGALESNGMLVKDEKRGSGPSGAVEVLPPVYEDWIRLAEAYETKFPGKTLKGSGYRSYSGQVYARQRRSGCGSKCGSKSDGTQCKYGADGRDIGVAAYPGQSRHGWGAAIDLYTGEWTTGGDGTSSDDFIWLNKFAADFNFVFNVGGERWHISWIPINTVLPNISRPGQPWVRPGTTEYNEVAPRYDSMTKT